MKSLIKIVLCTFLLTFVLGCQNTKEPSSTTDPETEKEKISYSIGIDMAQSIEPFSDEIDLAMLLKGIEDKIQGKELLVSKEEALPLLQAFSEKLNTREAEKRLEAAQKNLKEGQDFLEKNKTKEGVITTKSGLQYIVLKEGEGKSPGKSDKIMVHYKGTLIDGTEFDSSYKHGKPATFSIDQMIKGWTEGLQLMKEGGKYRLFIPADLAFGTRSADPIGPNSALIFDIELLEVLDDQTPDSKK